MSAATDRSEAAAGESSKSPAAVVYLAVVAGATMVVIALTVVGFLGIVSPLSGLPHLPLRVGGLMLLVLGFLVTGMLSGGIPPCRADHDESEWWRANSARAVITWAAAESLAILGGVFWLLTGDLILYVCLVAGGLGLLFVNRPQRMMEG